MAANRSPNEAGGFMVVRLSDIPLAKRTTVANRIIRVEGLVGLAALEMMLAAEQPIQNPSLEVPADKAAKVLR